MFPLETKSVALLYCHCESVFDVHNLLSSNRSTCARAPQILSHIIQYICLLDTERLLGCLRMLPLHDTVFKDVLWKWLHVAIFKHFTDSAF